jgi:hypothetical protein
VPESLATLLVVFGHHATTTRAAGRKGMPDYGQLWYAAIDALVTNPLTVLGNAIYGWTAATGWR